MCAPHAHQGAINHWRINYHVNYAPQTLIMPIAPRLPLLLVSLALWEGSRPLALRPALIAILARSATDLPPFAKIAQWGHLQPIRAKRCVHCVPQVARMRIWAVQLLQPAPRVIRAAGPLLVDRYARYALPVRTTPTRAPKSLPRVCLSPPEPTPIAAVKIVPPIARLGRITPPWAPKAHLHAYRVAPGSTRSRGPLCAPPAIPALHPILQVRLMLPFVLPVSQACIRTRTTLHRAPPVPQLVTKTSRGKRSAHNVLSGPFRLSWAILP